MGMAKAATSTMPRKVISYSIGCRDTIPPAHLGPAQGASKGKTLRCPVHCGDAVGVYPTHQASWAVSTTAVRMLTPEVSGEPDTEPLVHGCTSFIEPGCPVLGPCRGNPDLRPGRPSRRTRIRGVRHPHGLHDSIV